MLVHIHNYICSCYSIRTKTLTEAHNRYHYTCTAPAIIRAYMVWWAIKVGSEENMSEPGDLCVLFEKAWIALSVYSSLDIANDTGSVLTQWESVRIHTEDFRSLKSQTASFGIHVHIYTNRHDQMRNPATHNRCTKPTQARPKSFQCALYIPQNAYHRATTGGGVCMHGKLSWVMKQAYIDMLGSVHPRELASHDTSTQSSTYTEPNALRKHTAMVKVLFAHWALHIAVVLTPTWQQ